MTSTQTRDSELEMLAQQMGFNSKVESVAEMTPETEEGDEDLNEVEYPEENATVVPFYKQGFPKAILVGGLSLAGIVVLMNIYGGNRVQVSNQRSSPATAANLDPNDPRVRELEEKNAQTQAELALAQQRRQFAGGVPSPTGKPTPAATPQPPARISQPTRIPVPPPLREARIPLARAVAPPRAPEPPINRSPVPRTEPSLSPAQELQNLQALGRQDFGTPNEGAAPPAGSNPGGNFPMSSAPPLSNYFANRPQDQGFLGFGGGSSRDIPVGTTISAKTREAIVWAGGRTSSSARMLIQTTQPIQDSKGTVIIPQGTLVLAALRPVVPDAGLAELDAIGVILDGKEYALPPGAIVIRDTSGQPLQGKEMRNGRHIRNTILGMLSSGISATAGLANRPRSTNASQFSSFGGGSSTTTTVQPPPNYLGAAAEGAFGRMAQDLQNSARQNQQEISQGSRVYSLARGKKLQLFINQSVAL
jgi:hypothetical protein